MLLNCRSSFSADHNYSKTNQLRLNQLLVRLVIGVIILFAHTLKQRICRSVL